MFTTEFLDLPALDSANGSVSLPGSKSISNRVLLLAALSQGTTTIHDLLDSDDTRVMLAGLKQLGCSITPDAVTPGQAIDVTGIGGQLPAGTAATPGRRSSTASAVASCSHARRSSAVRGPG